MVNREQYIEFTDWSVFQNLLHGFVLCYRMYLMSNMATYIEALPEDISSQGVIAKLTKNMRAMAFAEIPTFSCEISSNFISVILHPE